MGARKLPLHGRVEMTGEKGNKGVRLGGDGTFESADLRARTESRCRRPNSLFLQVSAHSLVGLIQICLRDRVPLLHETSRLAVKKHSTFWHQYFELTALPDSDFRNLGTGSRLGAGSLAGGHLSDG